MEIDYIERKNIVSRQDADLYPIIEIELFGNAELNSVLNIVLYKFNISCRLLHADIQYVGDKQFGNLRMLFKCSNDVTRAILDYLNQKRISNSIKGYAA